NAFATVGEAEPRREIGDRLDVVGLQPVVGIHIVGMLANDRAHYVYRVYGVCGGGLLDLGAQPAIVLQQRIYLAVLGLEGRVGGLCAVHRRAWNRGLHGIAVAGRNQDGGLA